MKPPRKKLLLATAVAVLAAAAPLGPIPTPPHAARAVRLRAEVAEVAGNSDLKTQVARPKRPHATNRVWSLGETEIVVRAVEAYVQKLQEKERMLMRQARERGRKAQRVPYVLHWTESIYPDILERFAEARAKSVEADPLSRSFADVPTRKQCQTRWDENGTAAGMTAYGWETAAEAAQMDRDPWSTVPELRRIQFGVKELMLEKQPEGSKKERAKRSLSLLKERIRLRKARRGQRGVFGAAKTEKDAAKTEKAGEKRKRRLRGEKQGGGAQSGAAQQQEQQPCKEEMWVPPCKEEQQELWAQPCKEEEIHAAVPRVPGAPLHHPAVPRMAAEAAEAQQEAEREAWAEEQLEEWLRGTEQERLEAWFGEVDTDFAEAEAFRRWDAGEMVGPEQKRMKTVLKVEEPEYSAASSQNGKENEHTQASSHERMGHGDGFFTKGSPTTVGLGLEQGYFLGGGTDLVLGGDSSELPVTLVQL